MEKPSIKKTVARKAAKATAKHTAHGAASMLKRRPVRAVTLLAIGSLIGAAAGWILARGGSQAEVQLSA
jgi:membrane protein YqaA with SNARE-associated domain